MAYTKQNYQPGDVLTAEQMNKIQDAVIVNEGNIEGHIENKDNPHGVTPAQIGAVNKNGDTMTGALTTTRFYVNPGEGGYPTFEFHAGDVRSAFVQQDIRDGKRNVGFYLYQSDQDDNATKYYTCYNLPAPPTGQTANKTYDILTTKAPISVAQGGTGATDAETARANLGAVSKSGDTMTGNLNAPGFNVIGDSWNAFTFKSAAEGNPVRGTIMISNNNRIHFNQQQTGAKYAERYQLPTMASGLTADAWYNLVSTKHAKVLWNNGSPTSTFAAQTITINGLADCTTIAVVMNQTSGDSFVTIICRTVGATHTTSPMAARSDSANNNAIFVVRRSVTTNFSNNTISFGKGYQNNEENNARAIPVAVIGLY